MREKSQILPIFDHGLFNPYFFTHIFPIIYDDKMRGKTHILTPFSTTITFWTSFDQNVYPEENSQKRIFSTHFWSIHDHRKFLFESFSENIRHHKMTEKNAFFTHFWLCFDPFSPTFDKEIVRKNNEFFTLFWTMLWLSTVTFWPIFTQISTNITSSKKRSF